ncbi:MAG: haloacid dehalogenase, partial [Alloprevotella sp.]|nr:haloacid dehalogenase [Alloprevotella sp.]
MSSKLESIQGLSEAQVAESRSQYGANVFTPPARTPLWKQLLWRLCGPFGHYIKGGQDGDSLIFILEVITLLSFVTSMAEYFGWMGLTPSSKSVFLEPIGILCAVVLATGVSFLFETKAKREFELLNQTADDEPVRVVRSHGQCEVARRDVVVGDYVVLQTGDEVPADARLVRATALSIDESTLTGELLCHKSLDAESDEGAVYPSNVVLRGTKVMEGHGVAHVTAVGDATEAGRAFADSQAERRQTTPLVGQLDALGKLIANISYALAFLVFVARIYAFLHAADFDWAAMGTMDFGAYMLQTLM